MRFRIFEAAEHTETLLKKRSARRPPVARPSVLNSPGAYEEGHRCGQNPQGYNFHIVLIGTSWIFFNWPSFSSRVLLLFRRVRI
jgi:hypothetical protein